LIVDITYIEIELNFHVNWIFFLNFHVN